MFQLHKQASPYLGTVFIGSAYVGQTVNVEGQLLRHDEHLDGEPTHLCQAVNGEPVERLVGGTAGKIANAMALYFNADHL